MRAEAHDAALPNWLGGYKPYGVVCNGMTADELFDQYEACGFLYPAKRQQLAPFIGEVKRTWNASMKADVLDAVHHCLTYASTDRGAWGTVSMWRSSKTGFRAST
jgi:hypothetical protein